MLGGRVRHGIVRVALGAVDIYEVVKSAIKSIANNDQNHDNNDLHTALDTLANAINRLSVDVVQLFCKIEILAERWMAWYKG